MKKILFTLLVGAAGLTLIAFENYNQAVEEGRALVRAAKHREAVAAFQEAVKLARKDQELFWGQCNLAICYFNLKEYKNGAEAANAALTGKELSPDQMERAAYWKANNLRFLGKASESLAVFQQIREKKSKSSVYTDTLTAIGAIYTQQNKYKEARSAYEELLKVPDLSAFARNNGTIGLLKTYSDEKKYEEAIKTCREAGLVEATPNQAAKFLFYYVQALNATQQYKAAIQEIEKNGIPEKAGASWRASILRLKASAFFYGLNDIKAAKAAIDECNAIPDAGWGKNQRLTEIINAAYSKSPSK